MKKLLLVCVAVVASLMFSNTTHAQSQKIGYFDEQETLLFFPGIGKVDTLLQVYQRDSLGAEYEARIYEYNRADSIFRRDSAGMPVKVRELAISDLNKKRGILANWQTNAQQMYEAKMNQLLMPYKQKIFDALKLVIAEQKYTYVLNAQALAMQYAQPPILDNLGIRVAIKLKLPLPKEYEDAWKAAGGTLPGSAPAAAKK